MAQKALVTGADTKNGQAIIRALLEEGWRVVGTSPAQPSRPSNPRHDRYTWHLLDLADDRFTFGLRNMIEQEPVTVYHCAPRSQLPAVQRALGTLAERVVFPEHFVKMDGGRVTT